MESEPSALERQALEAELEIYIRAEAGGPNDLDEALEAAGILCLLDAD